MKEVKNQKANLERKAEASKRTEAERQETEAFDKCTTVEQCNHYLKAYPQGKYVNQVKSKKDELEKQPSSSIKPKETTSVPKGKEGNNNSKEASMGKVNSPNEPGRTPEQNRIFKADFGV